MKNMLCIQVKKEIQTIIKLGLGVMALILSLSISSPLEAETFPSRPVQLIVPFAAGSGNDLTARAILPYVEKALRVPVIIENAPGADSRIGMTRVYKADPNGYTIGIHTFPAPLMKEILGELPFKALNFSYIYAWAQIPLMIFVSEEKWKTFDEFLLEARKRPMAFGIPGLASVAHFLTLATSKQMNIRFKFIVYAGSAEGYTALSGQHIDANIGSAAAALGMIRGKLIRPILVYSFQQDANFPEVPLSPKYNLPTLVTLRGVFGPPNMPEDRVRILEKAFSQAATEPKLAEWAKIQGVDLVALGAKQFRQDLEKQQTLLIDFKDLLKAP